MNVHSKLSFFAFAVFTAFMLAFTACSGEDGKDGKDGIAGKDADEVNVDSLAAAIRSEVTGTLWDSLYAEPYVDSIYNILFDNTYAEDWMDSVRMALIDSLKEADYDSLYTLLYDSIYTDIYSQAIIRTLDAWTYNAKEDLYGAFANLYPLMYKDFKNSKGESSPQPLAIKVRNTCEHLDFTEEDLSFMTQEEVNKMMIRTPECRWKKVMVKAWIEGFSDTATATGNVNPDKEILLAPSFKFDNEALLELTAPKKTLYQIRAYALENDKEIPFFSASEPTTVHPMQINGAELLGVEKRSWYDGVWITPNMDSITAILSDISKKLPDGTLKAYQKYNDDSTVQESTMRVMRAIFEVLQNRNVKYVENDGAGSRGQKIDYPIDVLRSKQAVCNEFSFLVASVLEAIGFEVYIVDVPSHMFIGWAVEKNSKTLGFLETTMLGHKDATFDMAFDAGVEKFNDQAENFEDGTSEILSLKEIRSYGITPNDIP